MAQPILQTHVFRPADFVGGHVALDFINTVTGRNVATPRDWLDGYASLVAWARFRDEFDADALDALDRAAARDPAGARAALGHAVKFREALHRVVVAIVDRRPAPEADRSELERTFQRAMRAATFAWDTNGCRLQWNADASGLDLVLHVVAVNAIEWCGDVDVDRLRTCAGDNCGWVFIDTSRNGRRRWCDMATCGNVAKARTHYRSRQRT